MPESVCLSMILGNALGHSLLPSSNSSRCINFADPYRSKNNNENHVRARNSFAGAIASVPSSNWLSGRIRDASKTPTPMSTMLPTNGSCQLPVRSIIKPETTGLRMAANAEPEFIIPLAVPQRLGAMSMGVAHIGPMVISEKKKPPDRNNKEIPRLWVNINGISDSMDRNIQTDTMELRARRRLPVRLRILSVTIPPRVSPSTPARKTHEAYNADCLRSRV